MSLFDFPRINFVGAIRLNPGTANNDDYAQSYTWHGQPLALMDSKFVEARTYGMPDDAFISWAQQIQTFESGGGPAQAIPAEWNYYGDMSSSPVSIAVTGAQGAPSNLSGAALTFSGVITDVNSEGSPPATQFFFDSIKLTATDGTVLLEGTPSKGCCQWLNFYRNVNMQADAGAGGYVYHVISKAKCKTVNLPGFNMSKLAGVIFRYYLYRPIPELKANTDIVERYKNGKPGDPNDKTNPATIQMAGTFAPLYENETIFTTPVGRLLVANTPTIPTAPYTNNNAGGGPIELAPAVLSQTGNRISIDLIGTFPENYGGNASLRDPKFNFGPVTLSVARGNSTATIGAIDYTNVEAGNDRGWIFDFDISSNPAAQGILSAPGASFSLQSPAYGAVLSETVHYFVSNQQGIYAEQNGLGDAFLNQGTTEPLTVYVFSGGLLLPPGQCPPITVWQYRSIPLEAPGNAVAIATNLKPGEPIVVDTSQPGNYAFTFSTNASEFPPISYLTFMNPPYITNSPSITLRILPNNVDFSQYYVDPYAAEPVGNDKLTWDIVYQNSLRTYYLLYPAMNQVFPLNSEEWVTKFAQGILDRTETGIWMTSAYMPRTRDMSESRRKLLRAWCYKVRPKKT
jgi:hypothetical protein